MNKKTRQLDGKKLTTAQAIAQTRKNKKRKRTKQLKTLDKQESLSSNNDNCLGIITNHESLLNNLAVVDYNENEVMESAKDLKGKMTPRELIFLGQWLSGNTSKINAIKSAGFKSANDTYLYLLAKKIIEKYESQVEDHRIIFRAMGAGETFVAKGLIDLAKSSKSDMVRLNAYAQIAKILGLTKEQLEGAGGVTIIFEGSGTPGAPASLPGAPPLPPSQGEVKVIPSTKPMMITK